MVEFHEHAPQHGPGNQSRPDDSIPLQPMTISPAPLLVSQQIDKARTRSEHEPSSTSPEISAVPPQLTRLKSITVIVALAGVTFLNTMGSGILISALPRIAEDVNLEEGFLLWPASVYSLAAGCLLLIFGAVADVVGAKLVWVTGSLLYVVFSVAVGLSRTGLQIIMFRTFLGIAISMCLPTTVSLITNTFPKGTWRNVAFAANGTGNPLGYALGLVLGGLFTDTIGWRWSFFMSAIINFCISVAGIMILPSVHRPSSKKWSKRLIEDIDWVGAIIMSAALGILLYVLAVTTSSYRRLTEAINIALLVLSVVLLVFFPFWMKLQVKRSRPALIPNHLWKNSAFTTVCISVFFCWASLTSLEYFMTLVFQRVQGYSALQSSIRFLPHVVMGAAANIITGFLISKVKAQTLAVVSALITMTAGPLMATIDTNESYWYAAFWAMLLSPANTDVLFTVSNLVISDAYPSEVQSLAGGVFNEVSQIGNAVGLAVTAAIAASVTEQTKSGGVEALMDGYRAAFWTIFAATVLVLVILFFGLKKSGLVGLKQD